MNSLVGRFDRKFYRHFESNWDDQEFRRLILENVESDYQILDLGAGAGIVKQMNFRGVVNRVCGVDLDQRVEENPYLDEGRVGQGESIPYADGSFDLVFSDNVLEHLSQPEIVFKDVARVLRPGGKFMFKTPNKYHYIPLVARLTPHKFHAFINKLRGRKEIDTFPTRYRANCRKDIHKLATMTGFRVTDMSLIEGRPEYLRISPILYPFGILYERLVNRFECLSGFRILLIGSLIKQE